jgi:hypothetical protein
MISWTVTYNKAHIGQVRGRETLKNAAERLMA